MRSICPPAHRGAILVAVLLGAVIATPAAPAASATGLNIDRDHSTVGFSVRHLFLRRGQRFLLQSVPQKLLSAAEKSRLHFLNRV